MVKIAQISDIHWRGIARHEEYTSAFEEVFALLREERPDLIVNTGDTWHTKTQNITPEAVDRLAWMFNGLADIAPTINILGNHDGVLTNLNRQDAISPIIAAINREDLVLYKNSGSYTKKDCKFIPPDMIFHVYSPFDEEGWQHLKPVRGKINVALFHGSITGCQVDSDWRMSSGEKDVKFFKGMNFVMLGDIHKQQFLAHRLDENNVTKPWIGYPGSLIQQNYGELERKGLYIWEIANNKSWDVTFHEIANKKPFVTTPWLSTTEKTIANIVNTRGTKAFIPGTRFRITSNEPLQPLEARQLLAELREHHGASEVVFKHLKSFEIGSIEDTSGRKIAKADLRNSPEFMHELYMDYNIGVGSETVTNFNQQQLDLSKKLMGDYLHKLNTEIATTDCIVRNVKWSIKELEFSNLFRYGEDNYINFSDLNGLVGMFGKNRIGKSSAIGSIMYALYNTTDRGPVKGAHIINKNKTSCQAKMTINVDGTDYVISRETIRSTPKKANSKVVDDKTNTILRFYKVDKETGQLLEMNSVSRDDTDKEIRKLIGSPGDFLMTALSSQGGINKFIEEGSTQRKSILSRFLDLDIFEKLYGYAKEDYTALNQKTRKYIDVDWTATTARLQKEISDIEQSLEKIEAGIVQNDTEIREAQNWLLKNEKNPEQHKQLVEDYLKTTKAYNEYLGSIETSEEEIENAKLAVIALTKKQAELIENIQQFDAKSILADIEQLSEVRTKLAGLKEIFTQEKSTLESQRKAVYKLSVVPCGDEFPTCQFIKDGHESKTKIAAQEVLVAELSTSLAQTENVARELLEKKLLEQQEQHTALNVKLVATAAELDKNKELILQKETILKHMKENVSSLEEKMKAYQLQLKTANAAEIEKMRSNLALVTGNKDMLDNQKKDLLVRLGGVQQQLLNITKERAECKVDLEKLKIYETFANAFSKTGIPAMILKTQLPAINSEIAKILGGIVDFKVYLETDINSNSMDVYIEDSNSKRLIELASGMEKMISSLAIRIALINVSNLPRSDMFILDEGLGVLDQEGLQKCAELFTQIKTYFKTILIITHVDHMKDIVDKLLDIEDNGIESKITA
jgi:DNA repair exonuclease SbcCD ATPase subunit/DNA repair exonuclease SbcCD nuclease subunit